LGWLTGGGRWLLNGSGKGSGGGGGAGRVAYQRLPVFSSVFGGVCGGWHGTGIWYIYGLRASGSACLGCAARALPSEAVCCIGHGRMVHAKVFTSPASDCGGRPAVGVAGDQSSAGPASALGLGCTEKLCVRC